jgi:hypothetical protein
VSGGDQAGELDAGDSAWGCFPGMWGIGESTLIISSIADEQQCLLLVS